MIARWLTLMMAMLCLPSWGAGEVKHEITVVYWGSADCRWCQKWESDGMEAAFKAAPEFKKIKYFRIKNKHLKDDYGKEHFPAGLEWLRERYEWKEFSHPWRPGWQIYVDRKLVDTFYGTSNWQEKALPRIQELLAQP